MRITIDQEVPVFKSYAAERTRGLYNVDADDGRRFWLEVDVPVSDGDHVLLGEGEADTLPIENWQIGVVVGPSGSGKSSVVRELVRQGWTEWGGGRWPKDKPIIEVLGASDYARATASLSAVGLGSVPSWLRPHSVLSNGEMFRADMAKLLLSGERRVVLDEFTSVLDRQVAQVAAGAFAKSWRRKPGRRIILVTCHYDVLDWVQPDWWLDTAEGADEFAADRGVVQARQGDFQAADHRSRYRGDRVGSLAC